LLNEAQALDLRTGPAEQIVFSNAIWAELTMVPLAKKVARKWKLEGGSGD
jgi:hypothetical protein